MPAPSVAAGELDRLALGVAGVEQLARVVVPHRLRHLVDERVRLLGRGDPLRADGDGLDLADALVRVRGDRVGGEERVLRAHLVDLGSGDRDEVDAAARGGELGNGARRVAADEEERVEPAVADLVAGLVGLQVFRLDVLFGDAERGQDDPRVDQRARARLVERHALAFEVGDLADAGALARHDVDRFRVQVGDEPQIADLGLPFVDAGAGVGPVGDVRLREARFHLARGDAVDVGDRAVRRDGGGDETGHAAAAALVAFARARRVRNGVGDHAADRIISAGGAAGADAEELDVLGDGDGGDDGAGDGDGTGTRENGLERHGTPHSRLMMTAQCRMPAVPGTSRADPLAQPSRFRTRTALCRVES